MASAACVTTSLGSCISQLSVYSPFSSDSSTSDSSGSGADRLRLGDQRRMVGGNVSSGKSCIGKIGKFS